MSARLSIKICGLVRVEDAAFAADAGADAIGLNFVDGSPRRIDVDRARSIADAVRGRVEIVGVVADLGHDAILALAEAVGLEAVQLHGNETPLETARLSAGGSFRVYKAVRLGAREDIAVAAAYPGDLLVDARVDGALGGTGHRADWDLAAELAASRRILLAGGLNPDNVAEAVRRVRPFGVDVASGVERSPGEKDTGRIRAFIQAARA